MMWYESLREEYQEIGKRLEDFGWACLLSHSSLSLLADYKLFLLAKFAANDLEERVPFLSPKDEIQIIWHDHILYHCSHYVDLCRQVFQVDEVPYYKELKTEKDSLRRPRIQRLFQYIQFILLCPSSPSSQSLDEVPSVSSNCLSSSSSTCSTASSRKTNRITEEEGEKESSPQTKKRKVQASSSSLPKARSSEATAGQSQNVNLVPPSATATHSSNHEQGTTEIEVVDLSSSSKNKSKTQPKTQPEGYLIHPFLRAAAQNIHGKSKPSSADKAKTSSKTIITPGLSNEPAAGAVPTTTTTTTTTATTTSVPASTVIGGETGNLEDSESSDSNGSGGNKSKTSSSSIRKSMSSAKVLSTTKYVFPLQQPAANRKSLGISSSTGNSVAPVTTSNNNNSNNNNNNKGNGAVSVIQPQANSVPPAVARAAPSVSSEVSHASQSSKAPLQVPNLENAKNTPSLERPTFVRLDGSSFESTMLNEIKGYEYEIPDSFLNKPIPPPSETWRILKAEGRWEGRNGVDNVDYYYLRPHAIPMFRNKETKKQLTKGLHYFTTPKEVQEFVEWRVHRRQRGKP
eukprot:gene5991-6598_t